MSAGRSSDLDARAISTRVNGNNLTGPLDSLFAIFTVRVHGVGWIFFCPLHEVLM
jgi:hypothetical protein